MQKGIYHKLALYVAVGLLNAASIGFMYTTNLKPPTLASDNIVALSLITPKVFDIKQGRPIRILIPNLSLDVPIIMGRYNEADSSWEIGSNYAYFAESSALINNLRGNTLIYGHKIPNVFEKLSYLKPQDEAIVYTNNGYAFHYLYQSFDQVDPTDVSTFGYAGSPKLTLQTCSGSWDQYRALYSLKLLSVNKV